MDWLTIIYFIMFFFGIYFLFIFLIIYSKYRKQLYDYPTPSRFPFVSFLIPAYNEEDSIENAINAILKVSYPQNKKEVIVINDGSKDNTRKIVEWLMRKNHQIRLINKENSGKADSLNQGIKKARGELIAVTDADSYPSRDALKKMIGYFEDENVGAVTSRVLVKNKKNFLEKFQGIDYAVIAWGRKILDYVNSVYVTNGPLSLYRGKLLRQFGFDPKNVTEDIEVTWHILSEGYKTRMSYSAEVYTSTPTKLKKWINQRVRWNLGGLQTIYKYRRFVFRTNNLFGYFVVPYVSLAFFLALVGFFLFFRFLLKKIYFYALSVPLIFRGYNIFRYVSFNFGLTFLLVLGMIFFSLALIYYKLALKDYENKKIINILIYALIYRPLYILPLLISIYKLFRGDIRWYTK